MSDYTATPARPVSLFTIISLLVLFAAFLLVVRYFYRPVSAPPHANTAENYSKEKDAEWRANADARRKALVELRAKQENQLSSYAWADQKSGKVQLPIERAMELTAQQYGAKK